MGFCNLIIETKAATVTAAQTLHQPLNRAKSWRYPVSTHHSIYCALSHLDNSTPLLQNSVLYSHNTLPSSSSSVPSAATKDHNNTLRHNSCLHTSILIADHSRACTSWYGRQQSRLYDQIIRWPFYTQTKTHWYCFIMSPFPLCAVINGLQKVQADFNAK